jgi:hypothetical protein
MLLKETGYESKFEPNLGFNLVRLTVGRNYKSCWETDIDEDSHDFYVSAPLYI